MGIPIDGKSHAKALREETTARLATARSASNDPAPTLAVVLVDPDDASEVYLRQKMSAARAIGIEVRVDRLAATIEPATFSAHLRSLSQDPGIDGVLLEMPLPHNLSREEALLAIGPDKDVDGLHPTNLGALLRGSPTILPATAAAVIQLLEREKVPLRGAHAVVIGRSAVVGVPTALLLLQRDATVEVCHSKTGDLAASLADADLIVAAAGVPNLVRGSMVCEGAVVIDVGMNRVGESLVGDVAYAEVLAKASKVTPVPGGVGPMTVACLLATVVELSLRRRSTGGDDPWHQPRS